MSNVFRTGKHAVTDWGRRTTTIQASSCPASKLANLANWTHPAALVGQCMTDLVQMSKACLRWLLCRRCCPAHNISCKSRGRRKGKSMNCKGLPKNDISVQKAKPCGLTVGSHWEKGLPVVNHNRLWFAAWPSSPISLEYISRCVTTYLLTGWCCQEDLMGLNWWHYA